MQITSSQLSLTRWLLSSQKSTFATLPFWRRCAPTADGCTLPSVFKSHEPPLSERNLHPTSPLCPYLYTCVRPPSLSRQTSTGLRHTQCSSRWWIVSSFGSVRLWRYVSTCVFVWGSCRGMFWFLFVICFWCGAGRNSVRLMCSIIYSFKRLIVVYSP